MLLIYGTAFGLLLSAVNVYLRDMQYLVEVMMLLLLWASPIVYAWSMVKDVVGEGVLLEIYTNNPITLGVLAFQRSLWISGAETAEYPADLMLRLLIAGIIGIVLLVGAQRVFTRLQGNFAQAL